MTTLSGRYELEERIATGGMGEVWRGRDTTLGRVVAVKTLKTDLVQDPTFQARFRNEAKHTAALSHPGIANVFDYGEQDGTAYLVMEYVDGEPLSSVLAREGRLPPDRALDYVGQAALALKAAHDAGVIHRDVKPGNLLVRPDGVVKVTDFGVARGADTAPVTQTGLVVGTAAYLSPEQASGRPVTPVSDVYALGLVAYECLAGRRAFDGESAVAVALAHINDTPPALPKDVPPLVSTFVMRALDKDPQRRQPDAGDFGRTALALATALRTGTEPAATSPAVAAPPPTRLLPVATDDAERRRTRNIFIGVGAAVVAVGFLLLRACGPSTAAHTSTPQATSTPRPTPTPHVTITAADLLDRPVNVVRAQLVASGLKVRVTSVPTAGPAGNVVAVAPTGSVPRGSLVTVTVASPPPPAPPAGKGAKNHKGKHDDGGHGGR